LEGDLIGDMWPDARSADWWVRAPVIFDFLALAKGLMITLQLCC